MEEEDEEMSELEDEGPVRKRRKKEDKTKDDGEGLTESEDEDENGKKRGKKGEEKGDKVREFFFFFCLQNFGMGQKKRSRFDLCHDTCLLLA